MKIHLPNSATLANIPAFFKKCDLDGDDEFQFSTHDKWVNVHPLVLAFTAAHALRIKAKRGFFSGEPAKIKSLKYLVRMGLFNYVDIDPETTVTEHEAAGRFIPITQVKTEPVLSKFIQDLVPLLHADEKIVYPVKYVISELFRNVLEHSRSKIGAVIAAQYYPKKKTLALGIVDTGISVYSTMGIHKPRRPIDALRLALQPGITGTTKKLGGTEFNAGAGLFFVKSIASLSKNNFVIYSGDALYKLKINKNAGLNIDPCDDNHLMEGGLPHFYGTAVGIDIAIKDDQKFNELIELIRDVYSLGVKKKKADSDKKAPIFI